MAWPCRICRFELHSTSLQEILTPTPVFLHKLFFLNFYRLSWEQNSPQSTPFKCCCRLSLLSFCTSWFEFNLYVCEHTWPIHPLHISIWCSVFLYFVVLHFKFCIYFLNNFDFFFNLSSTHPLQLPKCIWRWRWLSLRWCYWSSWRWRSCYGGDYD